MRSILIILVIFSFSSAFSSEIHYHNPLEIFTSKNNPFTIFDEKYFKNYKLPTYSSHDGKINESCIKIINNFEIFLNTAPNYQETLSILNKFDGTLSFIKFCYQQGIIEK